MNTRIGAYGVFIQDGQILLVEKGPIGVYAGRLDLPGGGLEFGESPEEALLREWLEEVGMQVMQYRLLEVRSVCIQLQFHHLGVLYHIEHASKHPTCIAQDSFAWHPIHALSKERLTPFAYSVIKQMQACSCIKPI